MPAEAARGVSIVTVALNAAKDLPLTLESAIAQDHADLELIVVDGMSWDRSDEALRRYAGAVDRIVVREDAGIYYAMNDALEHVTKDYVLFLNAGDQLCAANAVSRIMAALEGAPDIVYGNHIYVDGRLELFRRSAPFELIAGSLADGTIDSRWLDTIPGHQATFVRADLLRRLRFDTRLRISADHELLFRAFEQGATMQYVDELVCHYFGGGFSVAMGERTKLEGVSVYRRFSNRPDLVDKLFYPAGSPFDPQTRRTGVRLGGFYPEETWPELADRTRGGDWIAGDGCEFLSPERATRGMELSGYNDLDDQQVDIWLGEQRIATAAVPRDHFRMEIAFEVPVPPSSTISLRPARAEEIGGGRRARVAMAVRAFRFQGTEDPVSAGLAPGESLLFRSGLTSDFLATLGSGWSEPESTHMWGIGPQSDLWLKLSPAAERLCIEVSGNPHVGDDQRVELLVNGRVAADAGVERGGRATMAVDCTSAPWRQGAINHVALRPSAFATPPAGSGDTRLLSICLWRLDVA